MRTLAFNLGFYIFTFCCAAAAWLLSLVAPGRVRGLLHFWTRVSLWGVRTLLGARIEIEGRETLPPGGPVLIVPKHQSELDVIVMLNLFPELGAIAMQELARLIFVGRILRALDYILVPVSGPPAGRTGAVVEGARRVRAEGRPVLIYPEGTLMQLGARERYRAGVWHIQEALDVPITPVAMSLGVIWPQRRWRKYPGATGAVRFLPPIPPGLPRDALLARLETEIEEACLEMILRDAGPERAAEARDRHARRAGNDR